MIFFRIIKIKFIYLFIFLPIIISSGCSKVSISQSEKFTNIFKSDHFPDLIIIKSKDKDSFSSLAEKYLGDSRKGYLISEFNNLKKLEQNQELIIPLEPFRLGGLTREGYQTVPILTYHNFSPDKTSKMTVRKKDFEEQMIYLKENKYHVVTMKDLIDFINYRTQLPLKSVVITVDDGWKSFYDIAYPILKKYGYPATLFVYTDLITGAGNHLSWSEIFEMANNGIDVQSHSLSHRYLNRRKPQESYLEYVQEVDRELKDSAAIIENETGKKVDLFAYPYGETNHLVSAYADKNGYTAAFTVGAKANSFNTERLRINRTMIFGEYSIEKFAKKLKTFEAIN